MSDSRISIFPSNRAVAVARLIFLMAVVLRHSRFTPLDGAEAETLGAELVNFITVQLTLLGVPGFFFISGGLFFKNLQGNIRPKLKRRVFSLLIPYLIWNCVGLGIVLLKKYVFAAQFPEFQGVTFSFVNVLKGFWSMDLIGGPTGYPYEGVMWFVRNLIVVTLVAVPIYRLFGVNKWMLLALAIALPFIRFFDYGLISSFFYFYAGGVLFRYFDKAKTLPKTAHIGYAALAGLTAWLIWCFALEFGYAYYPVECIFMLAGILGVLCAASLLTSRYETSFAPTSIWLRSAFFVYVVHGFCIGVPKWCVRTFVQPDAWYVYLLALAAVFLVTWYGCMAVFAVSNRLLPRLTNILSGNRAGATWR